jgi:5-methylcytosine-specific restriction endonuclease McrA
MGVIGYVPYWLESDTFADDEIYMALAKRNTAVADALALAHMRLKSKAAHLLTNGYLTEDTALRYSRGRRRVLELLCQRELGRPPLVHRKGDVCDCLDEVWIDGYDFRIHAFLKRNPSKAEYERNRAQQADRKDARLRAMVYRRDGGCCRYCRSGPLGTTSGRSKDRRKVRAFDHVDPDRPAGSDGDNYVTACDRCNTDKGHRLPHEADMVLLPEPTEAEIAAWQARGPALFDRPQDRSVIAPETRQDRVSDRDRDAITDRDPDAVAIGDPNDIAAGEVRPEHGGSDPEPHPQRTEKGGGTGRGAGRDPSDPRVSSSKPTQDQPPRTPSHPDVYHRRSRGGPDPPDFRWPPDYTRNRPSQGGPEP